MAIQTLILLDTISHIQIAHFFLRFVADRWKIYIDLKKTLRAGFCMIVFFTIYPAIIQLINAGISILYNSLMFIMVYEPSLGLLSVVIIALIAIHTLSRYQFIR